MEACGDDEEAREAESQVAANFLNQEFPETQFGAPKAGFAKWASTVRILNPIKVQCQLQQWFVFMFIILSNIELLKSDILRILGLQ